MVTKRKRLQEIEVQYFAKQIVEVLKFLRLKRIIHRDLQLSNLLLGQNMEIKLCDFGISGNLINSNAKSRNNAGCAGYMAPER